MKVKERECKSIISKSGIYGVDYSINPYIGCQHGCKYCYASFMRRFTDHSEPWGKFVDVKINARSVLEKDLMKVKKGSILISSVTDPYQPLEEKYKLSRKILKRLANTKFPVTILTKSDLVLRDLDLLKKFNESRISVGFSINYLDDRDRKIWEPNSCTITERLDALKKISESEIECYLHVGPYFEGITNLEEITKNVGNQVSEIQIENINLSENQDQIIRIVRENYPNLEQTYEKIRMNDQPYKQRLEKEVEKVRKFSNAPIRLFLD
ncbi:hypothetical protein AKJ57_00355 [candidate division MSBL1 archaeon SCGC-AAA259A05]|uniref:Radical SAM core domain-containing protein n=1 Tax=candidate division MSBL1 archaeon SCGC-AAA259A05 TaxID=1698259 RepID=A0A133UBW7_9EURY|nr:hypothetical protein AKJ57_00355 [candidate division MSBL1 archaeon SCGC-AAA259A05]